MANSIRNGRLQSAAFFLLCLLQYGTGYGQVSGCKDPAATNYNAAATVNDGSCMYNQTSYTPPVKVDTLSPTLMENSGLQMAANFLWSFNDGSGAAAIYRVDTISGAILQTVNLAGATNIDWEDIAFDGTHFYVGDFGNNADGARTDLKIYKFPLSAVPDFTTDPVTTISAALIDVISFSYADQVPVIATTPNNTRFDCEAMVVDGGAIHLFSKNWIDANTTHYIINSLTAGTYVAAPLETLATGYLVTGADKVINVNLVALLGYQVTGFASHYLHLLSDFSGGLFFNGNKRRIDLPSALTMGQAEGICFRNASYGYISNEYFTRTIGATTVTVEQKLRLFNLSNLVPVYLLPANLVQFTITSQGGAQRVAWTFEAPVKNLRLLYSADGVLFTPVHQVLFTENGSFVNRMPATTNCYRLMWQDADGRTMYSKISCLNGTAQQGLSGTVLRSNGQLSFRVGGTVTKQYRFRLLTTDGKLLGEMQSRVAPGLNTLVFPATVLAKSVVIVQAVAQSGQTALLISVEE